MTPLLTGVPLSMEPKKMALNLGPMWEGPRPSGIAPARSAPGPPWHPRQGSSARGSSQTRLVLSAARSAEPENSVRNSGTVPKRGARGSPGRGRHFGKPDPRSRSRLQTVMPARLVALSVSLGQYYSTDRAIHSPRVYIKIIISLWMQSS
jgi:hypothetical protein